MVYDSGSKNPKVKDQEMMEAVLKMEKEGWKQISKGTIQYVRPSGFGFVINVQGAWKWVANPNGQPQTQGECRLLEAAQQQVQNLVNAVNVEKK